MGAAFFLSFFILEDVGLVTKDNARSKVRFVTDAYDLDLTYITPRIIAMSFPASGLEATYRNSLQDVSAVLRQRHGENFMVFNVSERSYDISLMDHRVLEFGWPDHQAPPLERLCAIVRSMASWLAADPSHVCVVHCKGGKGRTGVVVAAYLTFAQQAPGFVHTHAGVFFF
jgi:tensin